MPAFARDTFARDHAFRHDHILGTSLDLLVYGAAKSDAQAAELAVLSTVERLRRILDRRDPLSEINRPGLYRSPDLVRVLDAYEHWESRTAGIIRAGVDDRSDLDALGKAYIVDRAAEAARSAAPSAHSIILDIGGDIRAFGETGLGIADPAQSFDNAAPLTHVVIVDRAMATSGNYARGRHILRPDGGPAVGAQTASVTAADCLTANALSLALCVLPPEDGLSLIEATPDAEALLVTPSGGVLRSSGFRRYEVPALRPAAFAGWTSGSQVTISLTLIDPSPGGGGGRFGGRGGFGRLRRPYVAVWAEDSSGQLVRTIALWASKPRWLPKLHAWWSKNGPAARQAGQMARATRAAGQYSLSWNGMTDKGEPAPPGIYRIWIETNREHGSHYQESALIDCSGKSASSTMKATPEFQSVKIDFGPATAAGTSGVV